jgi:hypothetical protein
MNLGMIQKRLGMRNNEGMILEESRLRDGGAAAGMPIRATTAAPVRDPLETRVGHPDESPYRE